MQTIIFADRKQDSLGPIDKHYCPALVPVAGRETIIHTIEDLVDAGIKHVYVVISSQAYVIERLLGNGSRWGMKIDYLLSSGEEKPSDVLKRLGKLLHESYLLVRGDVLRTPIASEFIRRTENIDEDNIHAYISSKYSGVTLVKNSKDLTSINKLHWPAFSNRNTNTCKFIDFESSNLSLLENITQIHTTSVEISNGNFKGISNKGLKSDDGYIHGKNIKLGNKTSISNNTFIGNNVHIGDGVELKTNVIINNDVLIDSGASLSNCLIFPDTYIGSNVNVENSLVIGNHIYRFDSDLNMNISDEFILSTLSNPSNSYFDRATGIILLTATAPLWIIGILSTYITSSGKLFTRNNIHTNKVFNSNHGDVSHCITSALELNTNIPVLRKLPWILNVINGDIRMVGASPIITDDESMNEPQDSFQYGLISSAFVDLPPMTPAFEKRMHEIVYDLHRSYKTDMRYAISSIRRLFSTELWTSKYK